MLPESYLLLLAAYEVAQGQGNTKPLPGVVLHLHQEERTPNPPWWGKPTLPPADAQIRPSHSPRPATPDAASLHRRQQPLPMHNATGGHRSDDGEHNGPHGNQQRRRHGLGLHPHPHRSRAYRSGPLRWALAVLFTVLAILVLLAAVGVLVVVLVLQPRAPYLAVQSARLQNLVYDQQGVLDNAELDLEVRATNVNAHAAVSFSELELRLSFHDMVIAVLRADPFVVPPKGVLPLGYVASSAAVPLDGAGRAAMEAALNRGVVPFRVNGQALTRWKVGGLVAVKYWTRLACQIRFFWPNGTALHFTCNSKSRSRF